MKTITLNLNQPTVVALRESGFKLVGMRGVSAQISGGLPVVWLRTASFSMHTEIRVNDSYGAYAASQQIMPSAIVSPFVLLPIWTGDTFQISNGSGTIQSGGPPTAITLKNMTMTPLTSGIAAEHQGNLNPICALPLYGQMATIVEPAEQVLLMFSNYPISEGTMLVNAIGAGLLIDLAGAQNRTVSYDINRGWVWPGSWGRIVPEGSDLPSILLNAQVAAV